MKNLKKLMFGFVAMVFAFGLVLSASAFMKAKKTAISYTYKLNSSNPNDYQDPMNWEITDVNSPACNEGTSLPCRVSYEGDFNTYVQSADLNDLLSIATDKKD